MKTERKHCRSLCAGTVALMIITVVLLRMLLPESLLFAAEWRGESALYQFLLSDLLGWALLLTLLIVLGVLFLTALCTWLMPRVKPLWLMLCCWLVLSLSVVGFCGVFRPASNEEQFKTLMVLSGREDWDGVLRYSRKHSSNSFLVQNIENLALAEKGLLSQTFRRQANRDVRNLVVLEIKSPYVSAMLSDIYWSMGEISMSQMYAFEANEKLGNYSPRLLKRLVQTNLVYGYYAVAAKYLTILSQNTLNDGFVAHYSRLMCDEAVEKDSLLSMKRLCIPAENGFPTIKSSPYDMQRILQQCSRHRTSQQYLDALSVATAPAKK